MKPNEDLNMQTQAVKLGDGWFIKYLPGFEDIKRDVINVDVLLSSQEPEICDYKELRGIAIMERYYEKQQREKIASKVNDEYHAQFRQQFGLDSTKFSDAIKGL